MLLVNVVTHNWAFAYVTLLPVPRTVVRVRFVIHNACANVRQTVMVFAVKVRFVIQRPVLVNAPRIVEVLARPERLAIKILVPVTVPRTVAELAREPG